MTGGLQYILPIVFGVSLFTALVIYFIGGRMAPKSDQNKEKTQRPFRKRFFSPAQSQRA